MASPQLAPATAADGTSEFKRTGGEPAALRDDVQHPARPAIEPGAELYSRRIGATGETFSLRALSKSEVRSRSEPAAIDGPCALLVCFKRRAAARRITLA